MMSDIRVGRSGGQKLAEIVRLRRPLQTFPNQNWFKDLESPICVSIQPNFEWKLSKFTILDQQGLTLFPLVHNHETMDKNNLSVTALTIFPSLRLPIVQWWQYTIFSLSLLLNKLNYSCRNYSREETIHGNMVWN